MYGLCCWIVDAYQDTKNETKMDAETQILKVPEMNANIETKTEIQIPKVCSGNSFKGLFDP